MTSLAYSSIGDNLKAIEYYSESLSIYKKFDNKSGIAQTIGNIGNTYGLLGKLDLALEYLNQAFNYQRELRNESEEAIVQGNIGVVYYNAADYDLALEHYRKALKVHENLAHQELIANVNGNIGNVYMAKGEYEMAKSYFLTAIKIHKKIKDKPGIARCKAALGDIYSLKDSAQFDPLKAESSLLEAIEIWESIGSKEEIFLPYKTLAQLYKLEKRWEESNEYLGKYYETEKEVLSENAKKQAEMMEYRRKIEESERDRQVKLARFQEQEKILHNILPVQIADRILEGEKRIANLHEHVSVFFSDIVGFTKLSQTITPDELLTMLNEIFSEFDRIARKHGLEKIKTIGDAYMAVAGVPMLQEDHAARAAAFAIDVIEFMKDYRKKSNSDLQIRVGLHCGRAIAGVIGENKFAYDLWGDSVNTASRMESHGEAGRIHVSEDFRNALKKSNFQFKERGEMEVKGKGKMKTYFLEN